jgi:hypothetical protein
MQSSRTNQDSFLLDLLAVRRVSGLRYSEVSKKCLTREYGAFNTYDYTNVESHGQ